DTSAYESSGVQVINPWQYSKQT
ncbi:VapC toxin family PIN domain ribonuclease, partial [Xylella fastidiosa]